MKATNIFNFFLLFQFFINVKSLNILTVLPYHGRSHFIIFKQYVEELARRGHNNTVISFFPRQEPLENYHDISLTRSMNILKDTFKVERSYSTMLDLLYFVIDAGVKNCEALLQNEDVQNLWKAQVKFDVVVVEQFNTDCPLALAYKLNAPVIGVTSHTLMAWHHSRFGIPFNPSYVQFQFLGAESKPTLFQRVERLLLHAYFNFQYSLGQKTDQNTLAQYFDDIPPLEELARDIKILLSYTNGVLFGSTLLPANVIEVHGHHVTEAKPLPKTLQKFMDDAEHGVIYISFGSIVRGSTISSDMMATIISVLSELPQRIIWKWEDETPPGNLKDVYFSKWLPQKDILGHPKVVAFFSHCGLGGTTEAIHFGVPILGMPILGDQPSNADAIEQNGFGVHISINDFTKEKLSEKFRTVLNPVFRERVRTNSKIWRDRPLSALDNAIFWTEYVARHKNFKFQNNAANVPFYQYLYLDVAFCLLSLCLLVSVIMYYTIKYLHVFLTSNKLTVTYKKIE